jgi:hypothetical protein
MGIPFLPFIFVTLMMAGQFFALWFPFHSQRYQTVHIAKTICILLWILIMLCNVLINVLPLVGLPLTETIVHHANILITYVIVYGFLFAAVFFYFMTLLKLILLRIKSTQNRKDAENISRSGSIGSQDSYTHSGSKLNSTVMVIVTLQVVWRLLMVTLEISQQLPLARAMINPNKDDHFAFGCSLLMADIFFEGVHVEHNLASLIYLILNGDARMFVKLKVYNLWNSITTVFMKSSKLET